MSPLPAADAQGNVPAVEDARASLARKMIRDRVAAGLTQRELAKRSGVSFEHLCRIESGKHTPSMPTIDKLDLALQRAITDPSAARTSKASRATKRKTKRSK